MKVKDLIERLQKEDSEDNIVIYTDFGYTCGEQEFSIIKTNNTIILTAKGDWV